MFWELGALHHRLHLGNGAAASYRDRYVADFDDEHYYQQQLDENEDQQRQLQHLASMVQTRRELEGLEEERGALRYQHRQLRLRAASASASSGNFGSQLLSFKRARQTTTEHQHDLFGSFPPVMLLSSLATASRRVRLGDLALHSPRPHHRFFFDQDNDDEDQEPIVEQRASPLVGRPAPPPPPLSPPQSLLEARAQTWGFDIVPIAGDGACMFRAIAHQVYGTQGEHHRVRRAAYEEATAHPDLYLADRTEAQRREFRRTMHQPASWGDESMLYACAQAYNVSIIIIHDFAGAGAVGKGGEEEDDAKPIRIDPPRTSNHNSTAPPPTIYLGFYHEMHYVALAHAKNSNQ